MTLQTLEARGIQFIDPELARIWMLDNVPHIKSYRVMLGEATAALGLHFGADDMDGRIGKSHITHAALAESPAGPARERMARLIKTTGRVSVERDAVYHELKVYA